jgi:hypothetical protein
MHELNGAVHDGGTHYSNLWNLGPESHSAKQKFIKTKRQGTWVRHIFSCFLKECGNHQSFYHFNPINYVFKETRAPRRSFFKRQPVALNHKNSIVYLNGINHKTLSSHVPFHPFRDVPF